MRARERRGAALAQLTGCTSTAWRMLVRDNPAGQNRVETTKPVLSHHAADRS